MKLVEAVFAVACVPIALVVFLAPFIPIGVMGYILVRAVLQ